MLLLEKFSSLRIFWSNQLHLSKLNGELGSETSDLSLNHPNFPCPFCTKIFDEKAKVERLYTFNGKEDLSAMLRLSVVRKLKTISTTATSFMILPCSLCPKIFKEKAEVIEPMEVQGYKQTGILNVFFLSRNLYEYWEFCETHCFGGNFCGTQFHQCPFIPPLLPLTNMGGVCLKTYLAFSNVFFFPNKEVLAGGFWK